tara:strand:+ start:751 stop:1551 length:801 start_codon:yes stop_codon:yes gene_type:complete
MKKQNTLISILIINYNNHSLLKRSIESCLKQSYKNIEILIFDDQSDDSSPNVLKKFIKNKKIKIFFNKNKKANIAALDAAHGYYFLFKKSKGKIICLLDSDDFYHKDKIFKIHDCFEKNKSYDFIQNLPIIVENNIKNYKKNRNNIFSYWPYFAPESCINFRRNFMLRFLKKNKYLNHKFTNVWLGFRMGVYAFFIENTFMTLNENITYYKSYGESKKYFTLGYSWFIRRKNSFDYLSKISKKKYKYKLNFDYFITLIFSKMLKYL